MPPKPLTGKKIVITRPKKQSLELGNRLKKLGARIQLFPIIRIHPPRDVRPLRKAISQLHRYDILIFTSPNGVHSFFGQFYSVSKAPVSGLSRLKVCAIGPKTGETLSSYGVKKPLVPKKFVAESLAQTLHNIRNKRILIPRARKARETLPRLLRQRGARVDVVEAYETLPEKNGIHQLKKTLLRDSADAITFTSSSTVESFVNLFHPSELKKLFPKSLAVSIGPITTQTLKKHKIYPILQAREYTSKGIAQILSQHFYGK
ncbi:MAG: uroporphyrinogen-III synthase [Elusimicrobia bacterium]|nr:uroporphyrinogen-III synthase [Elusimicrobiota bacterium]